MNKYTRFQMRKYGGKFSTQNVPHLLCLHRLGKQKRVIGIVMLLVSKTPKNREFYTGSQKSCLCSFLASHSVGLEAKFSAVTARQHCRPRRCYDFLLEGTGPFLTALDHLRLSSQLPLF